MFKKYLKLITVLLSIVLLTIGFLGPNNTNAFFNDKEVSPGNTMQAGVLDFSLEALDTFDSLLTPNQTVTKNVKLNNDGTIGFGYIVSASNFSSADNLCDYIDLEAKLDGVSVYTGSLINFYHEVNSFQDPENWQFILSLQGNDENYEETSCAFDLNFNSKQDVCFGFSDFESISNTVNTGNWHTGGGNGGDNSGSVVINEVYYDVLDNDYCSEEKSEWIELYNNSDSPVNIKDWQLCHGGGCNTINPNVSIPAYGFAIISHDAATWQNCFELAQGAELVHSLGGEWVNLGDDSGYVILKDVSNTEIDCVDWGGNNTCGFADGSVLDVNDGHSIARITKGVDNNLASDWEDLTTPNPGTNPHSMVATSYSQSTKEYPENSTTTEDNETQATSTKESIEQEENFSDSDKPEDIQNTEKGNETNLEEQIQIPKNTDNEQNIKEDEQEEEPVYIQKNESQENET
jgi:hypothetical protein